MGWNKDTSAQTNKTKLNSNYSECLRTDLPPGNIQCSYTDTTPQNSGRAGAPEGLAVTQRRPLVRLWL